MSTESRDRIAEIYSVTRGNPGHDYPDDWKHENGMYMSVCANSACRETFTGGKYRFICKACREAADAAKTVQ